MTTKTAPANTDDVIDSRDVMDRIEELQEDTDRDEDELRALVELERQARDYAADWEYGETLIRDSYFVTYAEEFFDEMYMSQIPESARFYIDYEAFARDLQMDYTAVEFDGVTYWVR